MNCVRKSLETLQTAYNVDLKPTVPLKRNLRKFRVTTKIFRNAETKSKVSHDILLKTSAKLQRVTINSMLRFQFF